MILTNNKPTTWKMLQDYVAKYFNESGYTATTPKTISLSRGSAEIDVYVQSDDDMKSIILCECKYWNSNITQEKVHAFRTIVTDSGANLGLLITTSDYQIGAKNASLYSNIKLLTWEGFIDIIKEKWIINKYIYICNLAKPLSVYTDPYDIDSEFLSKKQLDIYNKEVINHIPMYMIFSSYNFEVKRNGEIDYSYLLNHIESSIKSLNECGCKINSIEELFDFAEIKIRESIAFFEQLFGDYIVDLNEKIYF